MKKTVLIGMTAIALSLGACAKRTPPPEATTEPPPAVQTDPNSTDPNSLEVVELPALQADLVAKAGSDTVYFGTDEFSLDEATKTTLAAQARCFRQLQQLLLLKNRQVVQHRFLHTWKAWAHSSSRRPSAPACIAWTSASSTPRCSRWPGRRSSPHFAINAAPRRRPAWRST